MGLLGSIAGPLFQTAGAFLGAKAQKKAAKKAGAAIQGAADKNNALAGQVYQDSTNALAPYTQAGNPAGTQINALLGIGGPPGIGDGSGLTGTGQNSAFDNFRNSTGYQFRLGEANDQFSSNAGGQGWLQSGAAIIGRDRMNQDFASNEFSNYAGMLDNQQRLGLSATMGQAGLGQNYVGTVTGNNMYGADGQANAALIRGNSNPFAAAMGQLGGSISGGSNPLAAFGIKF